MNDALYHRQRVCMYCKVRKIMAMWLCSVLHQLQIFPPSCNIYWPNMKVIQVSQMTCYTYTQCLFIIIINIWFAIRRLNKYILYAEGLSKGMQPTQSVNEMKCINEKMTCNTQDTNRSWYVPKANVDHTVRGQWTITFDHSVTTPYREPASFTDYQRVVALS